MKKYYEALEAFRDALNTNRPRIEQLLARRNYLQVTLDELDDYYRSALQEKTWGLDFSDEAHVRIKSMTSEALQNNVNACNELLDKHTEYLATGLKVWEFNEEVAKLWDASQAVQCFPNGLTQAVMHIMSQHSDEVFGNEIYV